MTISSLFQLQCDKKTMEATNREEQSSSSTQTQHLPRSSLPAADSPENELTVKFSTTSLHQARENGGLPNIVETEEAEVEGVFKSWAFSSAN